MHKLNIGLIIYSDRLFVLINSHQRENTGNGEFVFLSRLFF